MKALLVALACLALAVAAATQVPPHGFVTVDLGALHLQIERLARDGRVELPVGPLLTPVVREHFPWRYSTTPPGPITSWRVLDGGWVAERDGRFHVIYPIGHASLAAGARRATGEHGPLAVSLAALALAAWAAVRLGARLGLAEPAWAGVLVGMASPLALYGTLVWGHAPGAAASALGWLALAANALPASRALVGGLAFGAAGACRNEGILLAAVVGAALAVGGGARGRRALPAYALGVALALAPVFAYNRALFGSFLDPNQVSRARTLTAGGQTRDPRATDVADARAPAQNRALARLRTFALTAHESLCVSDNLRPGGQTVVTVAILLALAVVARALSGREGPSPAGVRPALLALTAVCGLYLVFASVARPQQVPGLLLCSPPLVCGLAALFAPGLWWADERTRPLALAAGAFLGATFMRGSPGWQWGGRYLLPALPLLAVLSLRALEALGAAGLRSARASRTVLVALGVAMSCVGWRDLASEQRFHQDVEQGTLRGWQVGAVSFDHWWFSWENAPLALETELLFAPDGPALAQLLAHLGAHGVTRVGHVTRADAAGLAAIEREVAGAGWRVAGRRAEKLPFGHPWTALKLERP